MTRTVRTAHSEWVFDEEAKTYSRRGLHPGAGHPVPYRDGPTAYTYAYIPDGKGPLFVEHADGTTLSSYTVVPE